MRPWAIALGASLGAHALVLWLLTPRVHAVAKPHPLDGRAQDVTITRVSLASRRGLGGAPAASADPIEPRASSTAPAKPTAPASPPGVGASEGSPSAPAPAGEAGGAAEAEPGAPASSDGAGGTGEPEAAPGGGEAGAPGATVPTATASMALTPELTALMHARLAAVAEGCYPPAAKRFRQRGTVQLSFCIDASGAARTTEVTQSSGSELLDAAARTCVVARAAPFPPEAVERCFAVPVRFGAQ